MTPLQNNRHEYRPVYFDLPIFAQRTGRQKTLDRTVARTPGFPLILNLFVYAILIS